MDEIWQRSQTVDPEVRAYIHSLVNAVGGTSSLDDTYQIGDDAYAALQDLLRWLRLYDEKLNRFDVKRCIAEANLVKGDLLEILALWPESAQENRLKARLALACLQLLVPLTWPAELDDDKTTVNHHRHLPYLQLAQVGYKRAVLQYEHAAILRTAVRIALPGMAVTRRERSKRDEGIIKLVLYLFRNLAMITQPQMLPSQGDENDVSRSATIEEFAKQDVFVLLLTVGSGANDEFQDQDVVLLEILFHLLKGVDAKKLFMQQPEIQHKEADELRALMQKEKAMHKTYNRHAPSRHNRFGTMLWVKRDDDKLSTLTGQASIVDGDATLHMMDQSKKFNKPKTRGKKAAVVANDTTEFAEQVDLTDSARHNLRSFVESFLDSSFNPLFSGLRKAIEREADRVGEAHKRQYFYLISWFLSAEIARRASQKPSDDTLDNAFTYIASVLDQETFVLLNRNMQRFFDEKSWIDLQSTLLAFTQILLTVQSMAESKDEEDQEIAENIQNRIFYEEATHDRIVQVLRGYKEGMGFSYLDTITEAVHVFVRMLERYSKQNADLHIRSKRRARRKRKATITNDTSADNPDAEEDAEDEREAHATVSERKFDFARFSAKFLTQPCVDTFISLLHFYSDLTPDQLKRCHRYFYRLAFRQELAILLFRVDIILLFHRIIKGPGELSREIEGYKDWEQLIQQVFRRCFKWIDKGVGDGWRETCITEMLFSKIPNTIYYLQNGYERVTEKRAPRAPAELEFKASVEDSAKVPVIVSLLLEQGKGDAVEWIKRELQNATEEREAWYAGRAAKSAIERLAADGEIEKTGAALSPPRVFFGPDTDERKEQLFKDKHLRLLLNTLGVERLGLAEDVEAAWAVPPEVDLETLKANVEAIKKTEHDGFSLEEDQSAADLVRNKSATHRTAVNTYDASDDEDGDRDGGLDESLFPPNLREKRIADGERPAKKRRLTKRHADSELTEAEVEERAAERRKKEKERNSKIKSALYVGDSDDEGDDEEFFQLEAERHAKMQGVIKSALIKKKAEDADAEGKKKGGKGKGKGKKRKQVESETDADDAGERGAPEVSRKRRKSTPLSDEDEQDEGSEMDLDTHPLSRRTSSAESTAQEDSDAIAGGEEEEILSTSPPRSKAGKPLNEVSSNVAAARPQVIPRGDDMQDEDDDAPVVKSTARRKARAPFIFDDSDDE